MKLVALLYSWIRLELAAKLGKVPEAVIDMLNKQFDAEFAFVVAEVGLSLNAKWAMEDWEHRLCQRVQWHESVDRGIKEWVGVIEQRQRQEMEQEE